MALVGRIARARQPGQVIVNLDTDFPGERFRPGAELFTMRGGVVTPLTLTTVRFQSERPVIGLSGIETIEAAESLAGLELRIPAEQLAALPPGAFYHHDLVGCRVETRTGAAVGMVEAVEGTAEASRLVVAGAAGEIRSRWRRISARRSTYARRIVIDPPAGLLDLNA
jgi:16S rRNA processing protein RimM